MRGLFWRGLYLKRILYREKFVVQNQSKGGRVLGYERGGDAHGLMLIRQKILSHGLIGLF